MARLIQFYVPQKFKPGKAALAASGERGKIIEFQRSVIKKSA